MRELILIDRDGTICKDYPDEEWKNKIQPELIKRTVIYLKRRKKAKIIILSNQYLVAEKFMSKRNLKKFHVNFDLELRKNGIFVSKYYYAMAKRSERNIYTKPNPGMFDSVLIDCKLDENQKYQYIGDSKTDKEFAANAGIRFVDVAKLKY